MSPEMHDIKAALSGDLLPATDALADRVNEWVGGALGRAKVRQITDVDHWTAALPPFRKLVGVGGSESAALNDLRRQLAEYATSMLIAGKDLHTWESQIPEVSAEATRLVRLSHLRHLLRTRAKDWGGERTNLPAGVVERCLVEIDATVTRHAMQIKASPPPPKLSPEK